MSIRSALSWVIGETLDARLQRRERAALTAARLVRDLSAPALAAHGGVAAVPIGPPVDLSPSQWRGDEPPDAVMFPLSATTFVREGSVQVHRSAPGSRILAAVEATGLGERDRLVLVVTTTSRAEAVVLQRDADRPDSTRRGEVEMDASPADVDVRLLVVSPASAHGQERG